MQYFGGKQRILKELIPILQEQLKSREAYFEPFLGGCSVFASISTDKPKVGSDICEPLICLYQHIQRGGYLPDEVSEEGYRLAKQGQCEVWRQAFVGFGCSFAGKWFGGYARGTVGRNYALNAKNSLLKKFKGIKESDTFICCSYKEIKPKKALIYCDPPYAGTTGYSAAGTWNVEEFWQWVRNLSNDNTVLVSEYSAPADFDCIKEINTKLDIRTTVGGKEPRVERIFKLR